LIDRLCLVDIISIIIGGTGENDIREEGV